MINFYNDLFHGLPEKFDQYMINPEGGEYDLEDFGDRNVPFKRGGFVGLGGKEHVVTNEKYTDKVFKAPRNDFGFMFRGDTAFYRLRRLEKIKKFIADKHCEQVDKFECLEIKILKISPGNYVTVEKKLNFQGNQRMSRDQIKVVVDLIKHGLLEDPKWDNLPLTEGRVALIDTEPLTRTDKKKYKYFLSPVAPLFKAFENLRNLCIFEKWGQVPLSNRPVPFTGQILADIKVAKKELIKNIVKKALISISAVALIVAAIYCSSMISAFFPSVVVIEMALKVYAYVSIYMLFEAGFLAPLGLMAEQGLLSRAFAY